MEKNKNRTDHLAAGRKKLQQFRQRKDHRGGGKSSSKAAGKPEKEADVEELGKLVDSPVDPPVAPTSATVVVEDERGSEEVSAKIDRQEANHTGPERFNGKMDDRKGAAGLAADTDSTKEDPVMAATRCSPEGSDGGEEGPASCRKSLEAVEDSIAISSSNFEVAERLPSPTEESRGGEESISSSRGSMEVVEASVTAPSSGHEMTEGLSVPTKESHSGEEGVTSSSKSLELVVDSAAPPSSSHEMAEAIDRLPSPTEVNHGGEGGITCSSKTLEVDGHSVLASNSKHETSQKEDGLSAPAEQSHGSEDGSTSSAEGLEMVENAATAPSLRHEVGLEVEGSALATENCGGGEGQTGARNILEVEKNSISAPISKNKLGQVVEGSSNLVEEHHGTGDGLTSTNKSLDVENFVDAPGSKHEMGLEVDGYSAPAEENQQGVGLSTSKSLEMEEDFVDASSLIHKVASEVTRFCASAECQGGREEGLNSSSEGLEMGVSGTVHGGSGAHLVLEVHEMDFLSGMQDGTAEISSPGRGRNQQAKGLNAVAKAVEEVDMKPSDEHAGRTSCEENLEKPLSFTGISARQDEDGDASSDAEGEQKVNEGSMQQHFLVQDAAAVVEKVAEKVLPEEQRISPEMIIEKVKQEDSAFLSKSPVMAMQHKGAPQDSFADGLESIKRHIYLTCIANYLHLQLAEQTEMDANFYHHLSNEVCKLQNSVQETQESKDVVSEELVQCRNEFQAMVIRNEELESGCLPMKEEVEKFSSMASKLQSKLELSEEELVHLSTELTECKGSLEVLQKENLNLTASLTSEVDSRKKLEMEKELLFGENGRLAFELSEQKGCLLAALAEQVKLEGSLRELRASVEQLTEENLCLSSSLDIHKARLQELDDRQPELPLEARGARNQVNRPNEGFIASDDLPSSAVVSHAQDALPQKVDDEEAGDSFLFRDLKQHLVESENILQHLEKSIQGMHSYSVSLSRSGGRRAGVSKLIQAFESKALTDDNVPDEASLTEEQGLGESHALTKEHMNALRVILKQVTLDVGKAEVLLVEAQNCRKLCREIEAEYVTQRQINDSLLAKIDELIKGLSEYESRVEDQQTKLKGIQQNIGNEAERHLTLVEFLQKEVNETAFIYKQQRESTERVIFEAVEKLNLSTGLLVSRDLDLGSHVGTSVNAALSAIQSLQQKLEAATVAHHEVHTSCDELNKSFRDLQGRYDLACRLLNEIYTNLREIGSHSCQDVGSTVMDVDADRMQQFVLEPYEMHLGQLKKLLDDRFNLLSTNSELESELLNKNQEIEELKKRCSVLDKMLEDISYGKDELESMLMKKCGEIEELNRRCLTLANKVEDHGLSKDSKGLGWDENNGHTLESDNTESELYNHVLSRLEALVVSHLREYDEATNQIHSSKTCLRDLIDSPEILGDYWSLPLTTLLGEEIVPKVKELTDLQERLHLLSASSIQQEDEMKTLKERLSKMEETLEMTRSELQVKLSELEQSEERLSSVREKLSIAVAKGKGLIIQRDSLKQSIVEKSSELEKCQQELLSKEELLHELEAKLKSCSEVGRIEALESELSYIRNSATALRDSFLLKDSILQRIEEVLDDLDLPEHFHSKDIVEKIELLSRVANGKSSLPVTGWDEKNSMRGSQSDTGIVVMEACNDDRQPSSNSGLDDLKRKYEELYRKFYGLAEHNDMLEQSLMERNNLIQKWEELLDGIDMPLQLRVLEPEDKLEWLGKTLSEVQRQRDSLQRKIENLESSSDLLVVDLEESHKKISELSAEIVAIKSEKEFFAQSMDKLRFEYLNLSEKAVQDELERENLQRELADLQGKFVDMKGHNEMEIQWQKLHDLVISTLPECDMSEVPSAGSGFEHLEGLLKKLVDRYTSLSLGESVHKISGKELVIEERNLPLDGETSKNIQDDKEEDMVALRSELNVAYHNLAVVREEKDATMEKCHDLMQEVDSLTKQRNLLQEERTAGMEKYESLVLELEAVHKEKDILQEQLAQEEQKSASTREKLNVAVRKGKGLVQQRDSMKQTIEEMNTMMDHMKTEHNQLLEALESEKKLLMNRLSETEKCLADSDQNLNKLLSSLLAINISGDNTIIDPMQKIEGIGRFICDLQSTLTSTDHEAKKSKRAAELLLAELNEVQERADLLQEELGNAEVTLHECSKRKDIAEAARVDALSHLEQVMTAHSEERTKHIDSLVYLRSAVEELREGFSGLSCLLDNVFTKNVDLFRYVETFLDSLLKNMDGENVSDLPAFALSRLLSDNPRNEENFGAISELKNQEAYGDRLIAQHLALAGCSLREYMKEYDDLKERIQKHSYYIDQQGTRLSNIRETMKRKITSNKELSESLRRKVTGLESIIKEKEREICSMHRCISLLYETCTSLIAEIKNRKLQGVEENFSAGDCAVHVGNALKCPRNIDGQKSTDGHNILSTEENIRIVADTLVSTVRESGNIGEDVDNNHRQLKATIADLQRELQEKDIQMNRITGDLVSQIKEAESVANRYLLDLNSAKSHIHSLEKQVEEMENDRKLLELRVDELRVWETSSKEFQDKIKSLTEALAAKDQEIEVLMQALDEEESQMETIENRVKDLEKIVQEKNLAIESLESSRGKVMAKLSTTVNKFDELHDLSESLLAEVENLQSQLQGRNSEISFLRQEITRCSNDVLIAQEANKKYSSVLHELLSQMDVMVSHFGGHEVHLDDEMCSRIHAYTDILDKNLESVMAELEDLRVTAQSKDALLQIERGRVEELLCNEEALKNSLSEKETQIQLFHEGRDSCQAATINSTGHFEIEQMRKKVASPTIAPHVRSGRKINNDQVAIAIDTEQNDSVLEDEDDDKAHGFKSLTKSRIVPRATRPITDRIDAIWVSGDRLLMRQPTLRLGILIYWVALHALLASLI